MHLPSLEKLVVKMILVRQMYSCIPYPIDFYDDFSDSNFVRDFEASGIRNLDSSSRFVSRLNLRERVCIRLRCIVWDDLIGLQVLWRRVSYQLAPNIAFRPIGCFSGHLPGKIYSSRLGMWSNLLAGTWKFFAITLFGVCASQSVSRRVSFSSNAPSSKMRRNSAPSLYSQFSVSSQSLGPNAWMECGIPAGKYHRSPAF